MPAEMSFNAHYRFLTFILFTLLLAACSPVITRTPRPTLTPTSQPTSTATRAPVTPTLTPTPTLTSAAPGLPPRIHAPADGAVLSVPMPDFRVDSPPGSWTVHFFITGEDGYLQEIIMGVGAGMSGWMNIMYDAATPVPLPPGVYHWVAYGCRETAVGGCGPASASRTFTIKP